MILGVPEILQINWVLSRCATSETDPTVVFQQVEYLRVIFVNSKVGGFHAMVQMTPQKKVLKSSIRHVLPGD